MYIRWLCLISGCGFLISIGCHKAGINTPPDIGYAYFPIYVGMERHYWLDSILYHDFDGSVDTIWYEVFDRVDTAFIDGANQQTFRVLRQLRKIGDDHWYPNKAYTITVLPTRIEWMEDNLRFIKLTFPIQQGLSWNGNAYIESNLNPELQYLNGWQYQYQKVNVPDSVNDMHFDSTLVVLEANDSLQSNAYAFRTYSRENYALHVGLIKQHFIHWEQQCTGYDQQGNCLSLKPRKGFEVILRLKDTL